MERRLLPATISDIFRCEHNLNIANNRHFKLRLEEKADVILFIRLIRLFFIGICSMIFSPGWVVVVGWGGGGG